MEDCVEPDVVGYTTSDGKDLIVGFDGTAIA